MQLPHPVVLRHTTPLADFILWLLHHHEQPTTLVVCSDRQSFLTDLHDSIESTQLAFASAAFGVDVEYSVEGTTKPHLPEADRENNYQNPAHFEMDQQSLHMHPLMSRTLRVIAESQTVTLAFCPSVPALHAYLSTLPRTSLVNLEDDVEHVRRWDGRSGTRVLALVGTLALHRESASWSAQSLGLAFAAAVEAASRAGAKLIVVERDRIGSLGSDGGDGGSVNVRHGEQSVDVAMAEERQRDGEDAARTGGHGWVGAERGGSATASDRDPWDEEVPIVDVSTRAFGVSREREWMDRKVKVKDVVARWCRFQGLQEM